MKKDELAFQWLKRAKGNLERSKMGKFSDGIYYEDLCYDCQQGAEKALKALLISRDIPFPRTHSISKLLELLETEGIEILDEIKEASILTDYAVSTRYPGDYEGVSPEEFQEALRISDRVIRWVEEKI